MTTLDTPTMLLRAILANPEDDAPRLAYADVIEEAGDGARAEFIRVQIELERLFHANGYFCGCDSTVGVYCEWCHAADPLRRRERALLGAHGGQWFAIGNWKPAGVSTRDGEDLIEFWAQGAEYPSPMHAVVWRGFVSEVRCPAAAFMSLAGRLAACQPIAAVRLTDREPYRTVSGHYGWDNEETFPPTDPNSLPDRLWDLLEPKGMRRGYPSADAAHAALSTAAVAFARAAAGLPPLT